MNVGRLIAAIAACLTCGAPASAQRLTYLHGRVLDPSEAAVAEASVTVVSEDTGFRRTAESQSDGEYTVGSLQPGVYKITVRKEGFRTMVRFNVKLEASQPARADFLLSVGAIEETITVEGTAPLLSPDQASTETRVFHDEIERLPLNGRGLLALLELSPGANVTPATRGEAGQFTANGQRPNSNYFTVDGISANIGVAAGGLPAQASGAVLPAMSAFGSLDSLMPLEAVEEFRVQTTNAAPDVSRLPGAIVLLTSRAGTNQFHGSVAYRFRHELLAANDWFANLAGQGRAPLRMHDVAPSLGGPIRRDRTFFFLSYERLALRGPYVWQQPVPALAARQTAPDWAQPALDLFPAPNGADLGNGLAQWNGRNIRPSSLDSGVVRIDHAITSRATFFGRYNDSPSASEFGSTQVNRLDLRFQSLTLGLNVRPAARTVLDFRVNESQVRAHSTWSQPGAPGPAGCALESLTSYFFGGSIPCDSLVRFSIGGVGQVVSGREGDRRQRQFEILQSAAVNGGAHALRFGFDYRRIVPIRRDATDALGVIADDIAALDNSSNLWTSKSLALSRSTVVTEWTLWAQDTWQVSPRLTVTPGLRWEFSPPPVYNLPVYFYDPANDSVTQQQHPIFWTASYRNFAPRLGAAYRLTNDGRTVLRAAAGLFYDSSLSIATDLINDGPLSISSFLSQMHAPFSTQLSYGLTTDLGPPQLKQWNVSADRALGTHDVVSLGYVGSTGRRLFRREIGGDGNTPTFLLALTTNHGRSDYQALQVQYRRRVAQGLQTLASYAWSHSIDDDSSDAFLVWTGPGASVAGDQGSSDFDLRHSFTGALTYEFPRRAAGVGRFLNGWALDTMLRARSGFPITVLESEQYMGIALANAFRPDLAAGAPVWVVDPSAPGGRRINPSAFRLTASGKQGTLGRNAITGFGMSQVDLAARREFRLGERGTLQFRMEAFNALNEANFADPVRFLNSPMFGRSTSMLNLMLGSGSPGSGLAPLLQTGGARSFQAALRFHF
jgi:hypothetical protein